MASLLNNYVFQLTGTLLTSGTSVTISNDLELNATVAFTDARIVLKNRNATIIERGVATAAAGTLTFSKRGLEQGETEVENASLKKEWREGTVVYVTVLASQIVDKQSDNTFSGTQTFENIVVTDEMVSPVFADATARDAAITSPTDGMIAVVGGDLQHYNGTTVQRETADTGTPTPDASTSVAGKVQIATDAELGTSTTTGSTGAELVVNPGSIVKTSSGSGDENKLVVLNNQGKFDEGFIDDEKVDAASAESIVDRDTYRAGEPITAGESLFVEDMTTFALATTVQNIGDVSANTRVSIPVIGSGTASDELQLSLKKFSAPSVDLGIRIETDDSGEPSGTLADANATSTITAASLTTSLADTTVTLAGSITLTEGTKYHIVMFQGTYGAETVNGTNYYGVGYTNSLDTTTRPYIKRDGAAWVGNTLGSDTTDAQGVALSSSTPLITQSYGYKFTANSDLYIKAVNKVSTLTGGSLRALVKNEAGATLATATFSGDVATLSTPLLVAAGQTIRVEIDNSGSTYTLRFNSANYVGAVGTNITYPVLGGSTIGVDSNFGGNVESVTTYTVSFANTNMIYTTSDLYEPSLLSKTDGSFTYKLPTDVPRLATQSAAAGQYCIATTYGINDQQSGMTVGSSYFVSDTAGAISATPGTNSYLLGEAISATKLYMGEPKVGINQTILSSTSNTADTGDITAPRDGVVTISLSSVGASASITATLTYGASSPSSTILAISTADSYIKYNSASFPVKKGYHYRVLCSAGANSTNTTDVYFTPLT